MKDPRRDPLPDDTLLAARIRRGFEVMRDTRGLAGRFVGNSLSCANCHLNVGQREKGLPLVGTAAVFPAPNGRAGRLFSLEDRIRGCFVRSMNGAEPPPYDHPDVLAVSAYIAWLSRGLPVGESPRWRGQNSIAKDRLIAIEKLDPERGRQLFAEKCVACHGQDGQGVDLKEARPGPLWGPGSWNDGAGFARVYTLAGFIRYAMPLTAPGSLSDEEAQQLAAYIDSRERPSYPHKVDDYPKGAPVDAVYYPRYPANPLKRPSSR